MYLDRRHSLMQSFKDNLHHPQYLKKNIVEKNIRKWAGIRRSENSVQQVWKRRTYCDPLKTSNFISIAITTSHHHDTNFGYNSQVLRRKHPALGKKLNLTSSPFVTGQILRY